MKLGMKMRDAMDRMRAGRVAKLEAKSDMAMDQGNQVKAKRLANRAEKVQNRKELSTVKRLSKMDKKLGKVMGSGAMATPIMGLERSKQNYMGSKMDKLTPGVSESMQEKLRKLKGMQ